MKKSNLCLKKVFNYFIWIYFKCFKLNVWLNCIMVFYLLYLVIFFYIKKDNLNKIIRDFFFFNKIVIIKNINIFCVF